MYLSSELKGYAKDHLQNDYNPEPNQIKNFFLNTNST